MLFWPIVVVSLVLVGVVMAGPPVEGLLGDADARPPLVVGIVFATGLILAAAGRMLLRGGARSTRQAVLWLGLGTVVLVGYANRAELAVAYDRMRGAIHPSVALVTADGAAELRRARDGHYRAEAEVNGVRMRLMVDTGASMVLLPYEEVRALGIDPEALAFLLPVKTANGVSTVAPVRLSSVKIGPIAVFDVDAAVARPGMLEMALLGMSFLDRLSETSFRGDRLILRN